SITNLVVIIRSSLIPKKNHENALNHCNVALLDKYPQTSHSPQGIVTLLPSGCPRDEHKAISDYRSTDLLNQQILDLQNSAANVFFVKYTLYALAATSTYHFARSVIGQRGMTPEAVQMKVDTAIENRLWATRMTKHVMEMNKHLQTRLLDLVECRLSQTPRSETLANKKRRKLEAERMSLQGENQAHSPHVLE
ncbi:hypothetical protein RJ639_002526, partial [Escallonia herrerae]